MCGIVGYSGKRSAQEVLLNGLEKLEYRGYDSAGVALALEGGIHVVKSKGRLEVLRRKLEAESLPESFCGIGHTRWATHGEPSDVNSHPHSTPRVSIVHNGIIENYGPLKADLMAKGVTFESETDTEVLVRLIDYFCCTQPKASPLTALREALGMVRGSYALAVLFRPLGFGDWRFSTALLSGFIAKESVVSTLQVLLGSAAITSLFTVRSAVSFLVFTLLYTPCVAAVATIRRELGSRVKTVGVVLLQCGVAWLASYIAFAIGGLLA